MKKIFLQILFIIFLLFPFFVFADNLEDAFTVGDAPLGIVADDAGYNTRGESADTELMSMISTIIQAALSFLGVIFLILMIYGGYLWMTASGNEQQVEKAKSLITAAIIGLIIVVSAYAISYFVIAKLGGAALKQ